jgi:hypothetical protein
VNVDVENRLARSFAGIYDRSKATFDYALLPGNFTCDVKQVANSRLVVARHLA